METGARPRRARHATGTRPDGTVTARALRIPAALHRPVEDVDVDDDLEGLQRLVGGTLEQVVLPRRSRTLIVHGEGKVVGDPVNLRATVVWRRDWQQQDLGAVDPQVLAHETVHGDVLVVGPPDADGATADLPDADRDHVLAVCTSVTGAAAG